MKALVVQPSIQRGGDRSTATRPDGASAAADDDPTAATLIYTDVPPPPLSPGECRVAVRLAGICRTDLELCQGYAGFAGIPGHEFVGTIIDGDSARLGQRVVGEINVGCGQCPRCTSGLARHCPSRSALGIVGRPGAFAESLLLPGQNLLPVPREIPDEVAVFCEPLAAALAIFEQLPVPPGTRVLVLGDGKLGLLVSQVCVQHGLVTTLRGRHARKLALAERWGVRAEPFTAAVGPPPASERFPVVIECAGTPQALPQALLHTAPRGTLVLKSTYAPAAAAHSAPTIDWSRVVVDEIRVLGSRCGRFAPALSLLQQGKIDVQSLIDDRMPLSQGVAAFARAGLRGALKVLLYPDPSQTSH